MFSGTVEIVDLSSPAARRGHGRSFLRTAREVHLRAVDLPLAVGCTVALRAHGEPTLLGRVVQSDDAQVVVHLVGTLERRRAPRSYADVPLRYAVAPDEDREAWVRRWLEDGAHPEGELHSPDPLVDFSDSGIRFRDARRHDVGHVLLLELGLPGGPHRVVAEVVRVEFVPVDERTPDPRTGQVADHRTAARFAHISAAAVEALRALAAAHEL